MHSTSPDVRAERAAAPSATLALGFLAFAAALLVPPAPAQGVTFRKVAASLEPAPGTGGVLFNTGATVFSLPAIDDAGQTAFSGLLQASPAVSGGLWSEQGGSLQLVARTGTTPAPGAGAAQFGSFLADPLVRNDAGEIAFVGFLTGSGVSGTTDSGIWRQRNGALELVVRSGDPVPGAPALTFRRFGSFTGLNFDGAGRVSFHASFNGAGINSTNDEGICSTSTGVLALAAREGSPAHGVQGNYDLLALPPALSGQGSIAFNGRVNNLLTSGVWKGVPGSLVVVAKSRDMAPGTNGALFNSFFLASFPPAINASGRVAFAADLTMAGPSTTGIWSEGLGGLQLVARQGNLAPGTGAVFGSFNQFHSSLAINATGHVVLRAALEGATPGTDSGIWAQHGQGLLLVAREGMAAPGTGGAAFGDMHPQFFQRVAFNAASQVAFKAFLAPGPLVTPASNEGIWMTDPAGNLQLLLRKGDTIEVAPGDMRVVVGFDFLSNNAGGSDGRARALNDQGELALRVRFDTNQDAILVAALNVACPTPVPLCGGAPNSFSPTGATIAVSGSQSIAANDFTLESTGVPVNHFGLYFYGSAVANAPFGHGVRCIGGSLFRLPVVQSDGTGFASYTLDFPSLVPAAAILPGSVWNFQLWFRDPAAGAPFFNGSGAVGVTFCN